MTDFPTTLSFAAACDDTVYARISRRGGMTLDELYASLPSWPRARVLRSVLSLHNDHRVALRTRAGDIDEIHPLEVPAC